MISLGQQNTLDFSGSRKFKILLPELSALNDQKERFGFSWKRKDLGFPGKEKKEKNGHLSFTRTKRKLLVFSKKAKTGALDYAPQTIRIFHSH